MMIWVNTYMLFYVNASTESINKKIRISRGLFTSQQVHLSSSNKQSLITLN